MPLLLRCALLGDAPASRFLAAGAQFGCADPVNEVRKACGIPEPAKCVQILFRGGHGLGV